MYNTDLPTRADLPTNRQLLRSTAIAFVTAFVLLITVILPSEYAIDPTGVGRILGLTQMGEIKEQLAEEAALDAQRSAIAMPSTELAPEVIQPGVLTAPTEAVDIAASVKNEPSVSEWSEEISLQLSPGEAAEIKLVMQSGAVVAFEWIAEPGHLNSALHGDGTTGERITYRNGRAERQHSGTLTAAFDGTHGWFWRNRSKYVVTMTLSIRGEYTEIKRVI